MFVDFLYWVTNTFEKCVNLFKTYRKLTQEKRALIAFSYELIEALKDRKISDEEVGELITKLYDLLREQNMTSEIKEV